MYEIERRLEAGQLPTTISLISWKRRLVSIQRLEKHGISCACYAGKWRSVVKECALCHTYADTCDVCPITLANGEGCGDTYNNYMNAVSDLNLSSVSLVSAIKTMIEYLEKAEAYEKQQMGNSQ
jgi:hypothetical protein